MTKENPHNFEMSPDEARGRLRQMGISGDVYKELSNTRGYGSHEIRALGLIAKSDKPKNFGKLLSYLREHEP